MTTEYVSPEGLRLDGRRPHEMRHMHAVVGVVPSADGSALFHMGNTKVMAVVYGPHEVSNRTHQLHDRALVRCEYSMATFSTGERRRRGKTDRYICAVFPSYENSLFGFFLLSNSALRS